MSEISTAKTRISKKFYQQHPHLQQVIEHIERETRQKQSSVIFNRVPPNHYTVKSLSPSEHHRYYLVTPDGKLAYGQSRVLLRENAIELELYSADGDTVAYLYSGSGRPDLNGNDFNVGNGCYLIDRSLHYTWIYQVDENYALNAAS